MAPAKRSTRPSLGVGGSPTPTPFRGGTTRAPWHVADDRSGGGWGVADGFEVDVVGVEDEGAVVVLVVFGVRPWWVKQLRL